MTDTSTSTPATGPSHRAPGPVDAGSAGPSGHPAHSAAAAAPAGTAPEAPAATDERDHARRWLVLAVLALSQLMVVLDATIVNIALPSAQRELGFSDADRQWVVTAYSLAFGGLLLLGGRLSDLLGRRTTLLIGLVGFALASAAGGASSTFALLVAARTAQGAFGAVLAPSALSLLTTTFTDPRERGKAFGIFGAIAGGGAAIGLLLGGALTQYLDWTWCLYVNVPIAVVAIVGALVFVRASKSSDRPHLDVPGALVVIAGLVSLVYGFSRAESHSWTAGATLAFIGAGIVLLALFVWLQTRVAHPLLPLRIVTDRRRGGAYLAIGLTAVGMFAVFLFLAYYLQSIKDYSPLRSGVAFLPMVCGIVLSSTVLVTRFLPRVGPRRLIVTGEVLAAAGLGWMSLLSTTSSYAGHVLPALFVTGLGLGLIFGSGFNTATAGAERRDAGVASALVNTGQQVGGALGTALLNTIATRAAATHLAAASAAGKPTAAAIAAASVHGYDRAFLVASGILLASGIIAALVLPGGRTPHAAAPTEGVVHA